MAGRMRALILRYVHGEVREIVSIVPTAASRRGTACLARDFDYPSSCIVCTTGVQFFLLSAALRTHYGGRRMHRTEQVFRRLCRTK